MTQKPISPERLIESLVTYVKNYSQFKFILQNNKYSFQRKIGEAILDNRTQFILNPQCVRVVTKYLTRWKYFIHIFNYLLI